MWWELSSVKEHIRDEYRGWRDFKHATGKWPVCSILVGVLSIPACFAAVLYLLVRVLETGRLRIMYPTVFAIIMCAAAVWYGLRRLACKVDVGRAQKAGGAQASSEALEEFIR